MAENNGHPWAEETIQDANDEDPRARAPRRLDRQLLDRCCQLWMLWP